MESNADRTRNVARECKTSQKELDLKDSGPSKLRHSAAKRDNGFCGKRHTTDKPSEDCVTHRTADVGDKRDNGFCSKRDTDEKTSEDYVKYRTAAVARECKASQQGFDVGEKKNPEKP